MAVHRDMRKRDPLKCLNYLLNLSWCQNDVSDSKVICSAFEIWDMVLIDLTVAG